MNATTLLRDIVQASDANDHGSLMNAISAASDWLAQQGGTDATSGRSPANITTIAPPPPSK